MKLSIKINFKHSYILVFGFLLSACSDVRLKPHEKVELSQGSSVGNYCSDPGMAGADVVNFLFVVDMSGSNVKIGQNPGTDRTMERLKLIEKFLNEPCAKKNPNNKFGIIGFSSTTLIGSNTNAGVSECNGTVFKDPTQAAGQINALKDVQTRDMPIIDSGQNGQNMMQTFYKKGFECSQNIVTNHVNSLPEGPQRKSNAYMVYFLTDGLPTDPSAMPPYGSPNSSQYRSELRTILEATMTSGNKAGGIRIAPIFYGENRLSQQEKQDAHSILDFIGEIGNSVRTSVDNISSVEFCALMESGRRTKYTVKKFGVINLTARIKNGKLYADSDMDGILDKDEAQFGFDPAKPRSGVNGNELLDGICPKGVNANSCPVYKTCSEPNKLGLTSCDVEAKGLFDGVDSDRDLIPDFVEIVKGTQPHLDDRMKDLDGDRDPLWLEIDEGRDPEAPDADLMPQLRVAYTQSLSDEPLAGCSPTQESWSFQLKNIPLVRTLKVLADDPLSSKASKIYRHNENYNVILVYYIVARENDDPNDPSPGYLFGQILKVNYLNPVMNVGNFELLGEIDGGYD